jgi:hypothetical protein
MLPCVQPQTEQIVPAYVLDEDLPDSAARIARALGENIRSVRELGREGIEDEEQLLFAAAEGWILVSRNERDFVPISRQFAADGLPHAGVLIVTRSLDIRDPRGIAHALMAYSREHPEAMPPFMVDYLKRANS